MRGVDGASGLPMEGIITSSLVNEALLSGVNEIGEEIKHALERTPPQIHDHIQKEGIYITGGSTRIPNIDRYQDSSAVRCSFPSIMTSVPSVGSRN